MNEAHATGLVDFDKRLDQIKWPLSLSCHSRISRHGVGFLGKYNSINQLVDFEWSLGTGDPCHNREDFEHLFHEMNAWPCAATSDRS